jgi:hypothetical protein
MIICSNRLTEPCDRFSKFAPCVLLVRDCHSFSDSAIKAPVLTRPPVSSTHTFDGTSLAPRKLSFSLGMTLVRRSRRRNASAIQDIWNTAKSQRPEAKVSVAVCRQCSRLPQQEFLQAAHSASSTLLFHTTWRMLRAQLRLSGPLDGSFRRRGHTRLDYFRRSIVARTSSED